ncbi:hypothetical protein Mapa_015137 [Marchantia paleacea]|nr:hypothetical protein Mapa_015137 [Marchantia paleacea]
MIRLMMRRASEGPGCGAILKWRHSCALFANFFAPEPGPKFAKTDATVVGSGVYFNKSDLGTSEMRKQVQHWGSISGVSYLSTSAGLRTLDPLNTPERLGVQVGAMLKIDLSGTTAGISATAGDNLEEISIQPIWKDCTYKVAEWKSLTFTHSQNRVSLEKSKTLDQNKTQLQNLLELNANIPARWCSLDIQTSEGPVYVQSVREGTIRVTTSGGDVKLGEVKGGEAHVESHGGDFQAKLLQASSSVYTAGGKLSVNKLQGDVIKLDSGGGEIILGTVYGNDVTVQSRGGSLEARQIQAQHLANLSSDGGSISISGFDGNGAFVSYGGRVEIQVNDHAEEVSIDAADGDVILSLSSKLTAQLKYVGAQSPIEHDNILTPRSEAGVYDYRGCEARGLGHDQGWRGSENDRHGADNDAVPCRIVVFSAGTLRVRQKGWLDLI